MAAAQARGFNAFEVPMLEISRRIPDLVAYFPRLLSNTFRLRKSIRQQSIAIVHVNDVYNMLGLSLKLFAGVKVVTHIRRMPESFPSAVYRTWVFLHTRYADRIMPVSKANKSAFPDNDKIEVVYDPLPDAEQRPSYVPRPQLDKYASLLYLANYIDGKGHLHALKMLTLARKRMPDWSFTLRFHGGNLGMEKHDAYRDSLIRYAEAQGLSHCVEFLGPTSAVEEVMKAHDVVLNLSDSESFSRVTLEALFYGLPTLATDVGGTREMVIDGKTGILAPAKDVEAMYDGLHKILRDDELRVRLSTNAYTFVRNEFGWEHSVAPILRAYQELSSFSPRSV